MADNTENWEPRILAFLCNWCSYAGADLAGVSRIQYPPNIRIIRVPHFGKLAEVAGLPPDPVRIETGARVRVLEAKLRDGTVVTVPRANVEKT